MWLKNEMIVTKKIQHKGFARTVEINLLQY